MVELRRFVRTGHPSVAPPASDRKDQSQRAASDYVQVGSVGAGHAHPDDDSTTWPALVPLKRHSAHAPDGIVPNTESLPVPQVVTWQNCALPPSHAAHASIAWVSLYVNNGAQS